MIPSSRARRLVLLLPLLTIAACRTVSPPSPPDQSDTGLAQTLSVEERTHDGEQNAIDSQRHLGPLDYRSRVRIDPDREKLRQLAAGSTQSDAIAAESDQEAQELVETRRLIDSLQDYVRLSRRVDADVQAMRSQGLEASRREIEALKDAVRQRAEVTERLIRVLSSALEDYARSEGLRLDTDPETGDFLNSATEEFIFDFEDRLLPDGEPLSIAVATELIEFRVQTLEKRIARDREAIESGRDAHRLKLLAYLVNSAGERSRLHIENYDTLETGGGNAPKSLLGIPEKRWEEVQRRFALSADWARFLNDLRDDDSDLRKRLRDFSRELRTKLGDFVRSLGDRLEEFAVADLDELATVLEDNGAGADLVTRLRDLATRFRSVKGNFDTLRTEVETLLDDLGNDRLTDPSQVFALAKRVGTIPTRLGTVVEEIRGVARELATVEALIDTAIEGLTPAVKSVAQTLRANLQDLAIDALREAVPMFDDYPAVSNFVTSLGQELAAGGFTLGLSENVEKEDIGAELADDVIERPIDEVLPGAFNLDRLASPGERVEIVAQLVSGEEGKPPLAEHRQTLEVIGRGLYPTLDSHVIFANRQGRGRRRFVNGTPVPRDDESFQAAPGVSWTLHYRKEEETRESDGWAPFWNGLDPGLGLNVAALNFDDDAVEIGVGAHLTILGDLLQVGYGWNLSVGEDQDYFFVGIGLVEALNVSGLGNVQKTP